MQTLVSLAFWDVTVHFVIHIEQLLLTRIVAKLHLPRPLQQVLDSFLKMCNVPLFMTCIKRWFSVPRPVSGPRFLIP